MLAKAHKAAGARLCRAFAFAWASFAPKAFAFDSPLQSVAWHQLDILARTAVVLGCVIIPAVMLCALAAGGRKERRLGLALVGALALLWGSYARLAGTVWYVRPDTQGEYGLEDGTSPENAFDGNADIAWASINTGDALYACGDWLPADARIVIADSGAAGAHIKFSGNAGACGRSTNSTISRLGQTGAAGRAISAAGRNYVTIEDITLLDCDQYCISWDYTATTGTVNDDTTLHVNRVTFERCGGSPGDCIWKRGYGLSVTDSTFTSCAEDCIWVNGGDVDIRRNTFADISYGSIGGDAVQITLGGVTVGSYFRMIENDCDHTDVDVKNCFLVGANSLNVAHEITMADNEARCYENAGGSDTSCHPYWVQVTDDTRLSITGNYALHGRRGINIEAAAAATMTTRGRVSGNVIVGPSEIGIAVDSDTDTLDIANNVIARAGAYGISLGKSSADTGVVNNVLVGSPVGFWYIVAPTATRTPNAYYGNSVDILANATPTAASGTDVTADPQFVGGPNPTTAEGFRLSASSPLAAAGADLGDEISDFFGDPMYNGRWDIGAFRRDSCYRRSRDGKLDMARTRAQVVSRCNGIPGRYPEGL